MFGIPFRIGPFYNTPELALVVGNIFSYLVSPKQKLILHLKEKISLAPGIYNFIFTSPEKLEFSAGQYIEWTLGHNKPDNRGNRRYFTIASSPTEKEIILGAKFYEPSSTFKKKLLAMPAGESVIISQLAGDFTLPKDVNQPVVFIAGGIGVTPFRSMVKYMLDTQQKRPATLFFSNRSYADIVYKDIFDQAEKELGMKVVYAVNDLKGAPVGWKGHVGFVDEALIKASLPEYNKAIFYVSGPHVMVDAFQKTLSKMGVPRTRVRTDFFPGYA
jgi:ferredoxin-NADP reductase